jgi:catechol 2,3-dioxygenase-like lactoylglutathione lyase family enzyme
LHHISLPVGDLAASKALYDGALKPLGYYCVFEDVTAIGYGDEPGKDKLCLKLASPAVAAGPGFHLAFRAPSRASVDEFHAAALQHGGLDNGAPGLRPEYGSEYYAAFIIDPDGHRLEAVFK